eukprot:scaffold102746_cov20-Tisochrysis_lutea.AAC.3
MSADTHKFGLADKGTSVVLYASPEHRMLQYTSITDWSGGLYISPTMPPYHQLQWQPLHLTRHCGCLSLCIHELTQFARKVTCGPATPLRLQLIMAGSRPGALIATAWASMVRMGEEGYLESTRRLMAAVDSYAAAISRNGRCLSERCPPSSGSCKQD